LLDVSIIIVSWNTKDFLKNCLKSVYEQTQDIEYEIIVVDNGSTDGSAAMVKTEFAQVILIENKENRGFAAANNQGINIARGRYVLLLNSDTVVLDNAVAKTVRFADSHLDAAVVACRVLNPDRTLQPTCFMFPSILNMLLSTTYLYKLFPKSKFFGRERMTWWDRRDEREVDVVTGCFMLVRHEAIKQVGMMDEQYFVYGEETDWCYLFKKAGWKVVFAPVGEVVHFGGQSTEKIRGEMLVQLRLSILKFMGKHRGWLTHKMACFLVASFFAVRVPIWLLISIFGRKYRKQAVLKLRAYLSGIGQVLFTPVYSPARKRIA
jgi:GT2 family glycosyltransferase